MRRDKRRPKKIVTGKPYSKNHSKAICPSIKEQELTSNDLPSFKQDFSQEKRKITIRANLLIKDNTQVFVWWGT